MGKGIVEFLMMLSLSLFGAPVASALVDSSIAKVQDDDGKGKKRGKKHKKDKKGNKGKKGKKHGKKKGNNS